MSEIRDEARELDTRAWNGLIDLMKGDEDAITPEAVASYCAKDYLRLPNIGHKCAKRVRTWLARHGRAFRGETPVRPQEPAEPPLLLQVRRLLEEHGRLTWDLKLQRADAALAKERLAQLEKRFQTQRMLWDQRHRDLIGRHAAELQRIADGPNHVIPAAHALQRAILEMASDLATGQTSLEAFEALLARNFDHYRAWAGLPKAPTPTSDIEKQILATGGAL